MKKIKKSIKKIFFIEKNKKIYIEKIKNVYRKKVYEKNIGKNKIIYKKKFNISLLY